VAVPSAFAGIFAADLTAALVAGRHDFFAGVFFAAVTTI
jgi:hypothetical protein